MQAICTSLQAALPLSAGVKMVLITSLHLVVCIESVGAARMRFLVVWAAACHPTSI
jgi:hypothetical protein